MTSKPKIKDLQEGRMSCQGCSEDIHIHDFEPLQVCTCPECDAPIFIPFKIKNYWLYKPLGGGGMGSVYQALSEDSSGEYAVKVLPREQNSNQELINAITKEGEIGKILGKSPNIAEVVDYGCEEGEYYLASRFVEGTRLDVFISTASHLSERQALDILIQLIDAELHIINCGFLYRDIKPENIIIVEETASVKLFDFGLCMSFEQAASPDETDALEGSPYYLPPERIVGASEGEHSEIYSLGMLLFHMLSGTTYFSQSEIKQLLTKHVGALRVASVANRLKHCSQEMSVILDKMIKRDPNERYHELIPLQAELEELCRGSQGYALAGDSKESKVSVNIPPAGKREKTKEKKKPSKNIVMLVIMLVIVAIGVGGWHFISKWAEESERAELMNATAVRLGIPVDIKPPPISLQEVNNLISEQLTKKMKVKETDLPPFNEPFETSKTCKELSISVSAKKTPKLTITELNIQAEKEIEKRGDREVKRACNAFPEKKTRVKIAEKMGAKLPVTAPKKSLKDVQIMISKEADDKACKKYSSKDLASVTMKILQRYKSYRVGERITIMDQVGMKITGTYKGREGNKVVVGGRKIMLDDIIPGERIKFNPGICARKAADGIRRLKKAFKAKRKEYKKEYCEKIEKKYYNQYGYVKNKDKWVPRTEVIDAEVEMARKKFDKEQKLDAKKIKQRVKKEFNKEKYFQDCGYRKINGKWCSEKKAVNILVKEKRDAFNLIRDKELSRLKKEFKQQLEKELFESNRFVYRDNKWQPASSVLNTEFQKVYLQME